MELTQARVRELFDYVDGKLIYKVRRGPALVGRVAGCSRKDGYSNLCVDGKYYLLHRVVFLHCKGLLPEQVDHIDVNRSNNRIENLRAATASDNQGNREKYASNKSGHKGVCWYKPAKKWIAQIKKHGRITRIGLFDNLLEAAAAYQEAAKRLHGEFARF